MPPFASLVFKDDLLDRKLEAHTTCHPLPASAPTLGICEFALPLFDLQELWHNLGISWLHAS